MLPDNFPVFNIELECDFESSDNVYPPYNALKSSHNSHSHTHTSIAEE